MAFIPSTATQFGLHDWTFSHHFGVTAFPVSKGLVFLENWQTPADGFFGQATRTVWNPVQHGGKGKFPPKMAETRGLTQIQSN